MPVKFACQHCLQVLRVSSSKIGRRAKCPKCQAQIKIPTKNEAAESLVRRKKAQAEQHVEEEEEEYDEDDAYSEFVVYDDDAELVYETDEPQARAAVERTVDHDKVAVSRIVIYVQGALLGVVALVFFTFGVIVGIGTGSGGGPQVAQECLVSGRVQFADGANQKLPDDGAVVMLLPEENTPEKGAEPTGLAPGGEPPADDNNGLWTIREIGGAYGRTDANGEFKLRVESSKRYYVLVISNKSKRKPSEQLVNEHIQQIGDYFRPPTDLIGDSRYQWQLATIRGTRKRLSDVVFD